MIGTNIMSNNGGIGESSPPQSFVKIPQEDRTKYEKLGSNDVTSDDSDSEFFQNDNVGGGSGTSGVCGGVSGGGGGSGSSNSVTTSIGGALSAKKTIFKQIVANNIQDKIHAVYSKVDKTQVKVQPIVRKLKSKAVGNVNVTKKDKKNVNRRHTTTRNLSNNDAAAAATQNQIDDERSDND